MEYIDDTVLKDHFINSCGCGRNWLPAALSRGGSLSRAGSGPLFVPLSLNQLGAFSSRFYGVELDESNGFLVRNIGFNVEFEQRERVEMNERIEKRLLTVFAAAAFRVPAWGWC